MSGSSSSGIDANACQREDCDHVDAAEVYDACAQLRTSVVVLRDRGAPPECPRCGWVGDERLLNDERQVPDAYMAELLA